MQTETSIIRMLNQVLRSELTMINQYFLHARMLKNWGYSKIEEVIYRQSILAMKHADGLVKRIFFLEGLPNLQDLGKLLIGESVKEALQCDLEITLNMRATQQSAIAFFEEQKDFVSRALLEAQLADTEDYIDWLEEQHDLISATGLENYLQLAMQDTGEH